MRYKAFVMLAVLGACTPAPDAGNEVAGEATVTPANDSGIIKRTSSHSVAETMARLEQAVTGKGLEVIAKVDHAANASKAGLTLPPAMVLIFGNPQLGTTLMQASPSLSLDLPQRISVYTASDGAVMVAYNDPAWLASRHGAARQDATVAKVGVALDAFATAATN